MLRVIILIIAIVGLFGAWYLVLPTGKSEQTYPITGFDRLIVSDGIWAKVYTDQDGGVRARVLRGDIDNLIVKKSGRTLEISVAESDSMLGPWARNRFQISIWVSDLSFIKTDQDASLEIVSGMTGDLKTEAHNGSNLLISEIIGTSISATATNEGSVTIYGACNRFNAFADSDGSVNASGLECLNVSADARSNGSVETTAVRRAELNAIGGRIVMSGGAEVARERSLLGGEIIRP